LPALVLLFFTIRMNRQDNELRTRRAEEARQQKAAEIGRHMADRLEKAEQTLLQGIFEASPVIHVNRLIHPELVFAGRIRDGELEMPWDSAAQQALSSQDERAATLVLQAQNAELAKNSFRYAASLLNQALALATSASQKSSIRLQTGRILAKSGDK